MDLQNTGLKALLKTAAAGALIGVLLFQCRWSVFWQLWSEADPRWWYVAFLAVVLQFSLGWCALTVLLAYGDRRFGLRNFVEYGWIQSMASFTPCRAGEFLLLMTFRQANIPIAETTAAILTQRASMMAIQCCFAAAIISSWFVEAGQAFWITRCCGALAVASTVGGLLYLWRYGSHRIPLRWRASVSVLVEKWREMWWNRRERLLAHFAIVSVRVLSMSAAGYFLLRSFGVELPLTSWIGISAAVSLATSLPISIWGLGVAETALVLLLSRHGMSAELVVGYSIVGRTLGLAMRCLWCIVYAVANLMPPAILAAPVQQDV